MSLVKTKGLLKGIHLVEVEGNGGIDLTWVPTFEGPSIRHNSCLGPEFLQEFCFDFLVRALALVYSNDGGIRKVLIEKVALDELDLFLETMSFDFPFGSKVSDGVDFDADGFSPILLSS